MKTLFIAIILCLFGCSASPETEQTTLITEEKSSNEYGLPSQSNAGSGPCSQIYYKKVEIDGQEVWKPLPTACNVGLNLDKGDPAPDKGRPPENINQNNIIILEQR